MGKHLRKLFSVDHVKEVFRRYLSREIAVDQASAMLKIRRRQFFKLVKLYREKPESFSLDYTMKIPGRKIDAKAEAKITQELKKEAEIIEDKRNPVRFYNYSVNCILGGQVFIFAVLLCGSSSGESMQQLTSGMKHMQTLALGNTAKKPVVPVVQKRSRFSKPHGSSKFKGSMTTPFSDFSHHVVQRRDGCFLLH